MKWLIRLVLGIIAIPFLALGALFAYKFFYSHAVRYRLSLDIAVEGRLHHGSGVIAVSFTDSPNFLSSVDRVGIGARGEAVMVDLGERGMLFVLLKDIPREINRGGPSWGASPEYVVQSAFPPAPDSEVFASASMRRYTRGGESRDLQPAQLPMMVRFRNIADPKSVEQVDPANLAASFGTGVSLTRAWIETLPAGYWPFNIIGLTWPEMLVGTPVTRGIDRKLVWLESSRRTGYLDGQFASSGTALPNVLHGGDFKKGQN